MSLADRIKVKTCYTRSTNVERDSGSVATIAAYHPTTRGVALLEDVAAALGKDNQPRACTPCSAPTARQSGEVA